MRPERQQGHAKDFQIGDSEPVDREVEVNDAEIGTLVAIGQMAREGRDVLGDGDSIAKLAKRGANAHAKEEIPAQDRDESSRTGRGYVLEGRGWVWRAVLHALS
eukprot:GHVL01024207.1.p5 GENE.GHVL01024207.1~~GHVL01024207.1.p5  ORF type:complete len:104 (+),score=3.07 GHVL01024207.1:1409-1720(+)